MRGLSEHALDRGTLAEELAERVTPAEESRSVSTGRLAARAFIAEQLEVVLERYRDLGDGVVADYIPILAEADPRLFGIALLGVDGELHEVGDSQHPFSIQSISKVFVHALVADALGHDVLWERVGVNNTGLAFNSVIAIELADGHPMNPLVNAGALATTALAPGSHAEEQWEFIVDGLSRFAGRRLEMDVPVYESEAATNQRNRGIARLLESYGRIDADPLEVTDVYTRQCALSVTARDLAVMAATLADGGVNPVTGVQVVAREICQRVAAVMAVTGLYEHSGDWMYEIGMPAKSGVSGGIIAMAPGKCGLATFSPPLDSAGNSVRGQRVARHLSASLGLNLLSSRAVDSQQQ